MERNGVIVLERESRESDESIVCARVVGSLHEEVTLG